MATGIEIAGVVLATFPIIINALEHCGEGYDFIKSWTKSRADFQAFKTDFIRSKILFRQHTEILLSPIIDNDEELSNMLENSDNSRWKDSELEMKLKRRLSGECEYENFMATIADTAKLLNELQMQLNITDYKVFCHFSRTAIFQWPLANKVKVW